MKEQFVTYKTAKLAKEKYFREHCNEVYVETAAHTIISGHNGDEYYMEYEPAHIKKIGHLYKEDNQLCSAPTQSLLQKWLREACIINLLVGFNPQFGFTWKIISKSEGGFKNTYEEALEIGLQEALKLI
jgi:hypothetical protein